LDKLIDRFSSDERKLLDKLDSTFAEDYKERALHDKISKCREMTAGLRRQLDGLHQHHRAKQHLAQLASGSDVEDASKEIEILKRKKGYLNETHDSHYVLTNAVAEIKTLFNEIETADDLSAEGFQRTLNALPLADVRRLGTRDIHHDGKDSGKVEHPFNHLHQAVSSVTKNAGKYSYWEVLQRRVNIHSNPILPDHTEEEEASADLNDFANPLHGSDEQSPARIET
jgi:DNA repair exonuclease SbcCD ATPase subunit